MSFLWMLLKEEMKVLKLEALTPILTLNWSKFIKSPLRSYNRSSPTFTKGGLLHEFYAV
jgi:hypothetical protein